MYITRYTKYGMALYAVGGNEEAARMMGLNVDRTKIIAYICCAFFAGIQGLILNSRLLCIAPDLGTNGVEMTAIACVVLGGTRLIGGIGKFSGTFFGVLIICLISTIFNYQGNISTWWQNVLKGMFLLIPVILQSGIFSFGKKKIRRRI
jgi:ribose/xylose/arabinose/galactoside ABC-type transport system permease subunit